MGLICTVLSGYKRLLSHYSNSFLTSLLYSFISQIFPSYLLQASDSGLGPGTKTQLLSSKGQQSARGGGWNWVSCNSEP